MPRRTGGEYSAGGEYGRSNNKTDRDNKVDYLKEVRVVIDTAQPGGLDKITRTWALRVSSGIAVRGHHYINEP